ncbi:MAG: WecB/TagA/CpsF family glycosyltransferase [Pseudomonadota bacterium]
MTSAKNPHRIDLFGCPLDALTMEQAVNQIAVAIRQRRPVTHAALNTAKLINMRQNPDLYIDVARSDLVTADGMGIVLAARLAGHRLAGRVTGIDLMDRVLALCAQRGLRPFILGATQEVLDAAIYRIRLKYPGLCLAGSRHGYFSQSDEDGIVQEINESRADCLFVGLPTPKKERFIAAHRAKLSPSFVMGVGGSIDVLAGHVRRAPVWMQQRGLEWLYRTLQEPRRMWRRYLVTNIQFLCWLAAFIVFRAVGRTFAPLREPLAAR